MGLRSEPQAGANPALYGLAAVRTAYLRPDGSNYGPASEQPT